MRLAMQEDAGRVEDTKWFETLMFYAFRGGGDDTTAGDQDLRLVPTLVEKVVITRLTRTSSLASLNHRHFTKFLLTRIVC